MSIKIYRQKNITVHAIQITHSTFDNPHPNPEHLIGVIYDPVAKTATVQKQAGTVTGFLGDWLVWDGEGLIVVAGDAFADVYEEVQNAGVALQPASPFRGDFMIDLETLGTGDDAIILAIGAVAFDPIAGAVFTGDKFYKRLSWDDNSQPGRKIDAATLKWWLGQNRRVFEEMTSGHFPLQGALLELAVWLGDPKLMRGVWANGVSFDLGMLGHAYKSFNMKTPWSYSKETCQRTLRRLVKLDLPREGSHHNALDDAIHQAQWVVAAVQQGVKAGA